MTIPTSSPRVVSLGINIVDVLGRPVTGIPPGQGNLFVDEIRVTAAGTAAGTSVDLAKLGADVVAMGAIGDDELGEFLTFLMSRKGIDTRRLARKHGVQTSATILLIRPNAERPSLHITGASAWLEPSDVDVETVAGADVLHVGAPETMGVFAGEPLLNVLQVAKQNDVIVTMDIVYQPTLDLLRPLLPFVDYFMPNEDQLCRLTGFRDLHRAAELMHSISPATLIVKMGGDGSLVASVDSFHRLPALPIDTVDTTGCGDAYCAGFIVAAARGWDTLASAWFGTASAALVAQGLGSDAGIVDFSTTLEFLTTTAREHSLDLPVELLSQACPSS